MKKFSLRNPVFRIVVLFLIIAVFMIIPCEIVEGGSLCIYYNIAKIICPGCGTTRAFSNFFHFNFQKAADFNIVMTFTFIPALTVFLLTDIIWLLYNKISGKHLVSPSGYLIDIIIPKL